MRIRRIEDWLQLWNTEAADDCSRLNAFTARYSCSSWPTVAVQFVAWFSLLSSLFPALIVIVNIPIDRYAFQLVGTNV